MTEKLTKEAVDYRKHSGSERCGNCSMYRRVIGTPDGSVGQCSLVRGEIRREMVCDRWEPKR